MRPIHTLLFGLFLIASQGQVVILSADMPSVGDTVRRSTTTVTGFDGNDTGADHYWDFQDLAPLVEVADTAVPVGSTPFLYQFFFNNAILYPNHAANYAMKGTNFNLGTFGLTNVYDYFKVNATGFRNVGFGATIMGLPISVQRNPVDVIYKLPLEFGDMDTSFSTFQLEVPTLAFIRQQQTRYNHVDGWGTLSLPGGDYPVLRVRSKLAKSDSIYLEALGTGFTLPEPETIEYKWLSPGMDMPVLQVITTAGIVTQARYRDGSYPFLGLAGTDRPAPGLYPNPVTDASTLLTRSGTTGRVDLLDGSSRTVRSFRLDGSGRTALDVRGLAPGLYHVRITTAERMQHVRLLVVRP